MKLPSNGREALRWLFVAGAVALIAVVAVYAVNAVLAVAVTAGAVLLVGFLGLVVGGRLWDALRHGKPLVRGDWRSGGDGGGD
jgi:predicted lysophospholipase L1 biosynthesis ABC-type transport system permease subunit